MSKKYPKSYILNLNKKQYDKLKKISKDLGIHKATYLRIKIIEDINKEEI